jgi:anti-sigma factor RsiW
MKEVNAPNCGREDELIGFLYGELSDAEGKAFQRHIRDCASCNAELEALHEVRESVVAWRNESLGVISTPVAEAAAARVEGQKPSALAAMREFFNLAPLWMKGALAFASVLFCLFAGLAIARLQEKPQVTVDTNPGSARSEQEFNALVEQRVKEELAKEVLLKQENKQAPSPVVVQNGQDRITERRVAKRATVAVMPKAQRPLSKVEREQLAADLRLVSAKNEGDLDLLDDGINQ